MWALVNITLNFGRRLRNVRRQNFSKNPRAFERSTLLAARQRTAVLSLVSRGGNNISGAETLPTWKRRLTSTRRESQYSSSYIICRSQRPRHLIISNGRYHSALIMAPRYMWLTRSTVCSFLSSRRASHIWCRPYVPQAVYARIVGECFDDGEKDILQFLPGLGQPIIEQRWGHLDHRSGVLKAG